MPAPVVAPSSYRGFAYLAAQASREYDQGTAGRHQRPMSNQETIKGIREQLEAISHNRH